MRAIVPLSIVFLRIKKYSYATAIEIPLSREPTTLMRSAVKVNEVVRLKSVEKKITTLSKNGTVVKEKTWNELLTFQHFNI